MADETTTPLVIDPPEPKGDRPPAPKREDITAIADDSKKQFDALRVNELLRTTQDARTRALTLGVDPTVDPFPETQGLSPPTSLPEVLPYHARQVGMSPEEYRAEAARLEVPLDDLLRQVGVEGKSPRDVRKSAATQSPFLRDREDPDRDTLIEGEIIQAVGAFRQEAAGETPYADRSSLKGYVDVADRTALDVLGLEDKPDTLAAAGTRAHADSVALSKTVFDLQGEDATKEIQKYSATEGGHNDYLGYRAEQERQRRGLGAGTKEYEDFYKKNVNTWLKEIAAFKTAGLWTAPVYLQIDFDDTGQVIVPEPGKTRLKDALKPNVELIGFNSRGEIIVRQDSALKYFFDLLDTPQSFAVGAGEELWRQQAAAGRGVMDLPSTVGEMGLSGLAQGGVEGIQQRRVALHPALESAPVQESIQAAFREDQEADLKTYAAGTTLFALGFLATILTPDLTNAMGAAITTTSKLVRAGSDLRAAKALETVATARAAGNWAEALEAESLLRQKYPNVAQVLDEYDASVARGYARDNPEMLYAPAKKAADELPLEEGIDLVQAHPSMRRKAFSISDRRVEKREYLDQAYNTEAVLDRIDKTYQAAEAKDVGLLGREVLAATAQSRGDLGSIPNITDPLRLNQWSAAPQSLRLALTDPTEWRRQADALVSQMGGNPLEADTVRYLNTFQKDTAKVVADARAGRLDANFDKYKKSLTRARETALLANESRAASAALLRDMTLGIFRRLKKPLLPALVRKVQDLPELSERALKFVNDVQKVAPNLSRVDVATIALRVQAAAAAKASEANFDPDRFWTDILKGIERRQAQQPPGTAGAPPPTGPAPTPGTPTPGAPAPGAAAPTPGAPAPTPLAPSPTPAPTPVPAAATPRADTDIPVAPDLPDVPDLGSGLLDVDTLTRGRSPRELYNNLIPQTTEGKPWSESFEAQQTFTDVREMRAYDVAQWLRDNAAQAHIRLVMDRIVPLLEKSSIVVKFVSGEGRPPKTSTGATFYGLYSPTENAVIVAARFPDPDYTGIREGVLAHELIHAVTSNWIYSQLGKADVDETVGAVRRIGDAFLEQAPGLLRKYERRFEKDPTDVEAFEMAALIQRYFTFLDEVDPEAPLLPGVKKTVSSPFMRQGRGHVPELLTYALTDPQAMELMKNITLRDLGLADEVVTLSQSLRLRLRTVWDAFVGKIALALGLETEEEVSALTAVLAGAGEIFRKVEADLPENLRDYTQAKQVAGYEEALTPVLERKTGRAPEEVAAPAVKAVEPTVEPPRKKPKKKAHRDILKAIEERPNLYIQKVDRGTVVFKDRDDPRFSQRRSRKTLDEMARDGNFPGVQWSALDPVEADTSLGRSLTDRTVIQHGTARELAPKAETFEQRVAELRGKEWWADLVRDRDDYSLRELTEKYGYDGDVILRALENAGITRKEDVLPQVGSERAAMLRDKNVSALEQIEGDLRQMFPTAEFDAVVRLIGEVSANPFASKIASAQDMIDDLRARKRAAYNTPEEMAEAVAAGEFSNLDDLGESIFALFDYSERHLRATSRKRKNRQKMVLRKLRDMEQPDINLRKRIVYGGMVLYAVDDVADPTQGKVFLPRAELDRLAADGLLPQKLLADGAPAVDLDVDLSAWFAANEGVTDFAKVSDAFPPTVRKLIDLATPSYDIAPETALETLEQALELAEVVDPEYGNAVKSIVLYEFARDALQQGLSAVVLSRMGSGPRQTDETLLQALRSSSQPLAGEKLASSYARNSIIPYLENSRVAGLTVGEFFRRVPEAVALDLLAPRGIGRFFDPSRVDLRDVVDTFKPEFNLAEVDYDSIDRFAAETDRGNGVGGKNRFKRFDQPLDFAKTEWNDTLPAQTRKLLELLANPDTQEMALELLEVIDDPILSVLKRTDVFKAEKAEFDDFLVKAQTLELQSYLERAAETIVDVEYDSTNLSREVDRFKGRAEEGDLSSWRFNDLVRDLSPSLQARLPRSRYGGVDTRGISAALYRLDPAMETTAFDLADQFADVRKLVVSDAIDKAKAAKEIPDNFTYEDYEALVADEFGGIGPEEWTKGVSYPKFTAAFKDDPLNPGYYYFQGLELDEDAAQRYLQTRFLTKLDDPKTYANEFAEDVLQSPETFAEFNPLLYGPDVIADVASSMLRKQARTDVPVDERPLELAEEAAERVVVDTPIGEVSLPPRLYHVPPDGSGAVARPLSASLARASETAALKADLKDAGFDPESPVVWLSDEPVSKTARAIEVDTASLDPSKIIPTGQAEGYVLYVGDLPKGRPLMSRGEEVAERVVPEELEAVLEKFEGKAPNLQSIAESGRFNVKDLGLDERAQRHFFEYTLKGTEDWPRVQNITRDPNTGREWDRPGYAYDPEIVEPVRDEGPYGVDYSFELKPGWLDEVPTDDTLMYRGMSWEEWQAAQRSGQIQSIGEYNLGPEQEGLTYYSSDAGSASYYASSFAPVQFKATPDKPAVVIAVRRRPGVRVEGTAEHEVGIREPISTTEIVEVWEGHPATATGGRTDVIMDGFGVRDGSRIAPGGKLAWRKGEAAEEAADAAATAGAQADELAEARRLWEEQGVESPFFKRWSGDLPVIKAGEEIPEGGAVVEAYHGTYAPDIEAFSVEGPPVKLDEYGDPVPQLGSGDPNAYMGAHFGTPQTAQKFAGVGAPGWLRSRQRLARTEGAEGTVYPAYIRLRNPIRMEERELLDTILRVGRLSDDALLEETMRRLPISELYDRDIDAYFARYESDDAYRREVNAEAIDVARAMSEDGKLASDVLRELGDAAREHFASQGYDSVVYDNLFEGGGDSYIVFEPEQVKSVLNRGTFDPADERILYSRADENLLVQHNLTASNLRSVLGLGGLAAPSLAVSRVEYPLTGFGEISLLGDSRLISEPGTRVFDADVYSPRWPENEFKVNARAAKAWSDNELAPYTRRTGEVGYGSPSDVERAAQEGKFASGTRELSRLAGMRLKYVEEVLGQPLRGETGADFRRQLDPIIEDSEGGVAAYEAWVQGQLNTLRGARQIVRRTDSGRVIRTPYTLSNIVRELTRNVRGGEGFSYGLGDKRALGAKQFSGLDEVKAARDRVVPEEEMTAVKDALNQRVFDLAERSQVESRKVDNLFDLIGESYKRSRGVKAAIEEEFAPFGLFVNETDEWIGEVQQLADDLVNASTGYFEGKPSRAVQLSEFRAAVVPNDLPDDLRVALDKAGVEVVEYDRRVEGDRQAKIAATAAQQKILFQAGGTPPDVGLGAVTADGLDLFVRENVSGLLAADFIFRNADNADYRNLARQIMPFLDGVEVRSVGPDDAVPEFASIIVDGTARGFARATPEGPVTIWLRGSRDRLSGLNAETLLHELLHAATMRRLAEGELPANADTAIGRAAAELEALTQQVIPEWKKATGIGPKELNADELLAWGLTNQAFQDFLDGIKVADGKSLFDRFVDVILKLIGLPEPEKTALTELIRLKDDILQVPLEDLNARMWTAKWQAMEPRQPADPAAVLPPLPPASGIDVQFLDDGRALLEAFGTPTIDDLARAVGVVLRRGLDEEGLDTMLDYVQAQGVRVGRRGAVFTGPPAEVAKAEDLAASALAAHLRTQRPAVLPLQGPLQRMSRLLTQVYQTIVGSPSSPQRPIVTPEVDAVFRKLLAAEPERPLMPRMLERFKRGLQTPAGGERTEVSSVQEVARQARRLGVTILTGSRTGVVSEQPATVENILRELRRNGVVEFSENVLPQRLELGYTPNRPGVRGMEPYALTFEDFGQLQRNLGDEALLARSRQDPLISTGSVAQMVEEEDPIEAAFNTVTGKSKVLQWTLNSLFGGDATFDLRAMPPEVRKIILGGERFVEQTIGDISRLISDRDLEAVHRYLAGEVVSYQTGRAATTSGTPLLSNAFGVVERWCDRMPLERRNGLQRFADLVQTDSRRYIARGPTDDYAKDLDKILKETFDQSGFPELLRQLIEVMDKTKTDRRVPETLQEQQVLEAVLFYSGIVTREGQSLPTTMLERSRAFFSEVESIYDIQTALRVMTTFAVHGAAEDVRHVWVRRGIALDADMVRALKQWALGMEINPEYAPAVKAAQQRFGLNAELIFEPALSDSLHLPMQARKRLSEAVARSRRRTTPEERQLEMTPGMAEEDLTGLPSIGYRYLKTALTRGAFVLRQRYFFMNTIDHFTQLAMTVGFRPAAASWARVALLNLSVFPGIHRALWLIAKAGADKGFVPADLVERFRKAVQAGGDRAGYLMGRMLGNARWRIEVNPILDGASGSFIVGDKVYNYRDLRRIAIEEAIFSSFDARVLENTIRDSIEDVADQMAAGQLAHRKRAVRTLLNEITKHTTEMAEAWSERERLGAMITLMESGLEPRIAAQLVVKGLYDYAGSVSRGDRALWVNLLFPFWAFQKNANRQVVANMFSAGGAYRMGVIRRTQKYGAEALTEFLYGSVADPYGVDVDNLPDDIKESYYALRSAIEFGYGPIDQLDDELRERLEDAYGPLELVDEQTRNFIENGYGGPENVPDDMRQAMYMIFSDQSVMVEQGKIIELNEVLMRLQKQHRYSMAPFAVRRPSPTDRAEYTRTRTGVAFPAARTEAVQRYYSIVAAENPDSYPYLEIYLPESTIDAGFRHVGNMVAVYVLAGQVLASPVTEETNIDYTLMPAMRNALTEVVDPESAPIPGAVAASAGWAEGGAPARVHPSLVPTIMYFFPDMMITVEGTSDPFDPDPVKEDRYYLPPGIASRSFITSPVGEFNRMLMSEVPPGVPLGPESGEPLLEAMGTQGAAVEWASALLGVQYAVVDPAKSARSAEPRRPDSTTLPP
ncbi:MAG: hypothetical protein Unbinned7358contig1000_25 [Prokaryotic dsDNA virus sp.]|nr:MAG: hypothetical protein Unbinned7358contig1000_25 [Prokaryotic dsDNA virus sp.]